LFADRKWRKSLPAKADRTAAGEEGNVVDEDVAGPGAGLGVSVLDDLVALAGGPYGARDGRRRHGAARAFVDWLGCALGGATHEIRTVVERYVAAGAGGRDVSGPATLIASPLKAHPALAALFNGTISHVLDFDDVNPRMTGHPGVVVFPALLALAEATGATFDQVLDAAPSGYSAAELLGVQVNPQHYEQGWHATGTVGAVASAVACCRLLGLSADATSNAVAGSACRAALRTAFGSHAKALNAGRAAEAGVEASLLSEAGLQVSREVLVGETGYFGLLQGSADQLSAALMGAVEDEPLLPGAIHRTAFKLHAACGATHSTIEAVATLARQHAITPAEVERIEVKVHPVANRAAGKVDPNTPLDAKFSVQHLAALAMFRYPILADAFDPGVFDAAAVVDLRRRVTVTIDTSYVYAQAMPATVAISTRGRETFELHVDMPKGRPGNPLSDEELVDKTLALASYTLSRQALDELSGFVSRVLSGEPCSLEELAQLASG
jgi:2-methylcitrate dehydratase PrpD